MNDGKMYTGMFRFDDSLKIWRAVYEQFKIFRGYRMKTIVWATYA